VPFTPLHLGPALFLGILLRRWLNLPTLLAASVIIDLEPLVVILLRLNTPDHGFFHSIIGAGLAGVAVGALFKVTNGKLARLWRFLGLHGTGNSHIMTGFLGSELHLALDVPTHRGLPLFFPISGNPLHGTIKELVDEVPDLGLYILAFCVITGSVGILLYAHSLSNARISARYVLMINLGAGIIYLLACYIAARGLSSLILADLPGRIFAVFASGVFLAYMASALLSRFSVKVALFIAYMASLYGSALFTLVISYVVYAVAFSVPLQAVMYGVLPLAVNLVTFLLMRLGVRNHPAFPGP
jgi:membrane-bound metal-dependent hydrolase YbcI (DUF457 family)